MTSLNVQDLRKQATLEYLKRYNTEFGSNWSYNDIVITENGQVVDYAIIDTDDLNAFQHSYTSAIKSFEYNREA